MEILVYIKNLNGGDKFLTIKNLGRIWINNHNTFGKWALMYSDDKYEYNTIFYSDIYKDAEQAKNKLIEAYKNGNRCVEL